METKCNECDEGFGETSYRYHPDGRSISRRPPGFAVGPTGYRRLTLLATGNLAFYHLSCFHPLSYRPYWPRLGHPWLQDGH